MKILKPKEVAEIFNVSVKTLQSWDNDKKLVAYRNKITNRRFYTQSQIDSILKDSLNINSEIDSSNNFKKENIALYSRVSNASQKDDLHNQIEFLKTFANSKGFIIEDINIYTDIGSGLNFNRKNWNLLLDRVQNKEIDKIIIAHKDRFIRFGFDWFEKFVNKFGCEIVIVNNKSLSPSEEMIQDLISIIHVFSCRLYGLRKYKKTLVENLKTDTCEQTNIELDSKFESLHTELGI